MRPPRAAARLRRRAEVVLLPGGGGRVPFRRVVEALGARGITTLLIEGGGEVAAAALEAGVVDRVVLFLAPLLLGGDGVAAVGPLGIRRVRDALRLA